jgi:hypothetical protein
MVVQQTACLHPIHHQGNVHGRDVALGVICRFDDNVPSVSNALMVQIRIAVVFCSIAVDQCLGCVQDLVAFH